jgi:hypothetical protein
MISLLKKPRIELLAIAQRLADAQETYAFFTSSRITGRCVGYQSPDAWQQHDVRL